MRLPEPRESVGLSTAALAGVVLISLVLGIVAALAGGSFTRLGDGAGGLFGVPSVATTLIALVSIPIGIAVGRRLESAHGRLIAAVVVIGGAWIVAVGYFVVAHAADPCLSGWWDSSSRIRGQPLCEPFGPELNYHTRFHLLAHALPGAILLSGYVWSIRRWVLAPTGELDGGVSPG